MGKLKPLESGEAFRSVLQKSGLLSPERLARLMRAGEQQPRRMASELIAEGVLTRWQASQLLVGWHSLTLGKYKLLDQIGRGDLGRVFLAEHAQMGRRVAIKMLSSRHTQDDAVVERFYREAREAAALDHRNVIHLYDIEHDQHDGRLFLVMEYIQGRDLQRVVEADGPMGFVQLGQVARQIADGLQHAHELGLLHRDLKPANVLIDAQGVVKILGLGVGQLTQEIASSVNDEEVRATGAADFISPEQAAGSSDLDAHSDIYALGCVVYFLLTGRPPFAAGSDAQRRRMHMNRNPKDVLELRQDIPLGLARICRKMMAKNPEERHHSAASASQALMRWLANYQPAEAISDEVREVVLLPDEESSDAKAFSWTPSIGPSETPTVAPLEPFTGRPAWQLVAITAAVLCVLVLVTLLWIWLRDPSGQHTRASGTPRLQATRLSQDAAPPGRSSAKTLANSVDSATAGEDLPRPGKKKKAKLPQAKPADAPGPPSHRPAGQQPVGKKAGARQPEPNKGPVVEGPGKQGQGKQGQGKQGQGKQEKPKPEKTKPNTPPKHAGKKASTKPGNGKVAGQPVAPDLLTAWPSAVDLPPIDQPDAVSLGPLGDFPAQGLQISLRGVATAGGGAAGLALRRALRSPSEPAWEIMLSPKAESSPPVAMARLEAAERQLQFAWSPEAAETTAAEHLRNCILDVQAGQSTHALVLRTPLEVDAPRLALSKKRPTFRWPIPAWPELRAIQLEIIEPVAPAPSAVYDPPAPYRAQKDLFWIWFGPPARQRVGLQVHARLTRVFELGWSAHFQLLPEAEPGLWTEANLMAAAGAVATARRSSLATIERLKALERQTSAAENKKALTAQLQLYDQRLKAAIAAGKRLESLDKLRNTLDGRVAVQFQLFVESEGTKVVLLRAVAPSTQQPAP